MKHCLYYERFQRAIARSANWGLLPADKALFYADFLMPQPKEAFFAQPLREHAAKLEQNLEKLFRIDMLAQGKELGSGFNFDAAAKESARFSQAEVYASLAKHPLTAASLLFFIFEESDKQTPPPCLVTIGNVSYSDAAHRSAAPSLTDLRRRLKNPAQELQLSGAWLTFKDGSIVDPVASTRQDRAASGSLLSVFNPYGQTGIQPHYDPLLAGPRLAAFFGRL